MIQIKPVLTFLLRFALIYGLLIIPWPGSERAYAGFYRAGGAFLFESFGPTGRVLFEPFQADETASDVNMKVADTMTILMDLSIQPEPDGRVPVVRVASSSHHVGYLHTVFVIALILATPIPWSRKWRALLWGTVLANVFTALKLAILILYHYSQYDWISPFTFNPFWKSVLQSSYQTFIYNLEYNYIILVFVWALVSFRQEDWGKFLQKRSGRKKDQA